MKNAEKKIIYTFRIALLLFLNLFQLESVAQDTTSNPALKRMHIKGFIKDMQSAFFTDNVNSLITGNYIHNRINYRWDITDNIVLRVESRNRLYYGEQVKATWEFGKIIGQDGGYFDLTHNLVDEKNIVLNTSLDRVLLNWSYRNIDVTVGRQRINWGINLVWNPNDIFNTFNYLDFDYEERPGNDAVRVQYNTGTFSSFQVAYKPGKKANEHIAAVMYKSNFKEYDFQTFGGIYREDAVIGLGWAGNIKQIGFKGEATYFQPKERLTDTSGVFTTSLSLDRTFKGDYFVMLSYLYNSNGKNVFFGAADFTTITLSPKNLMPFEHTYFIQVSKTINPLLNVAVAGMYSPMKNTLVVFPTMNFSLSTDWDLALVAQSFFAETDKEYKTMGNAIYLRIRWSF